MKSKILVLLDLEWLHFGIVKYIHDFFDCEIFAIIDIDNNSKNFYNNQKLVPFSKFWFYRDYLSKKSQNPDENFLASIEQKYDIRLWEIAFSERFFSKYNKYYTFSDDEIKSILEKESKLFDQILEDIQPDFLITKLTDSHQSELLFQMCKSKNIKTLMMASTRLHNRYTIFDEYDKFPPSNSNVQNSSPRTIEDLKKVVDKHSKSKLLKPKYGKTMPISFRIKKYYKYLRSLDDNSTDYYAHFGKNKLSVISQATFLKKKKRRKFIEEKLSKSTDFKKNYVYFPLHVEPERQLLMVAPYFENQIEIIRNIAKSLPIDYRLVVKEHWMMEPRGWREISFYEEIMNIPNVELLHPSVDGEFLIKNCSIVATISGSSGFEALFHNKPVITFADNSYASISSVFRIKQIEDLPKILSSITDISVDYSELDMYLNLVEKNSFKINLSQLGIDFKEHFSLKLNTIKSEIDPQEMNSFLENHKSEFTLIANEHIKKMKSYID